MDNSILTSTKKVLGIAADFTAFDQDVLLFINGAFSTLHQLGVGPSAGFSIEDNTTEWTTFIDAGPQLDRVKTYVYLVTRLAFDPPATSFVIEAMQKQIEELTWRLNMDHEDDVEITELAS